MTDLTPHLDLLWPEPPAKWQLTALDVHVWASNLNNALEQISSFEQILSPEELRRASRFHFERDRHRFIAGRGILREILSSCRGISPSQLHFSYSPRGKPYLGNVDGFAALEFNLAHSEDLILVAVTSACALGIDVERIRPVPEFENIAINYFSTSEAAELMALPTELRQRAFYKLWTRKEASLKATGEGLLNLTNQFPLSIRPAEPANIRAISETSKAPARWTLVELTPAHGYIATLAAPATGLTLSTWQWTSEAHATIV